MGVAPEVGSLAYFIVHDQEGADGLRRSYARVNEVLARNGLPTHHEPEYFFTPLDRHSCSSFPYSDLHCMRRAFAHVWRGLPVPNVDELRPEYERERPELDRVFDDAMSMRDSHLLCHSDCDGFYVPIDFDKPIFDDDDIIDMLGSSQGLLRELIEFAPYIGIELVHGRPTPACEAELRALEDCTPLFTERMVWYCLFEAATLSIEHGSAIWFG